MDTKNEQDNERIPSGKARSGTGMTSTRLWIVSGIALVVVGTAWTFHSRNGDAVAANTKPAPLSNVTVSKPLLRDLDTRIGFLGQFSAVDQVELRAQVGGTLTGIHFKDGDIVHKGDLLFTIDSRPYDIKLSEAQAQLENATARLALANRELSRANELQRSDAGTVQNVEQRTSAQQTAQAAVDDAKAQIRDAQFDVEHCRITAPFTGHIGNHMVSVGNLVAGSRAATSPTTLLATLVSLDPIHLDFDMSEADFKNFLKYRSTNKESTSDKVQVALSDNDAYSRQGVMDFVDNAINRSSGTIHARATLANPDLQLTPGEFARLRLAVAAPAPTLLVPDAAVLPDQSQHVVLTVSADGTVTSKQVEVGPLRGGLRVVRSGLNANDRVIVDGLPYAVPGAKVHAQDGAIRFASNQE